MKHLCLHSCQFSLFAGHTFNIITLKKHGYDLAWMDVMKNFLLFRVRACNDAHLLISKEIGETDEMSAYEVVIGGASNTVLYIRKGSLTPSKAKLTLPGQVSKSPILLGSPITKGHLNKCVFMQKSGENIRL